ncbi:S10 family serine carboxypeptidase-like protein [Burkholderia ubonensis]|uniref:S10 family serine carboxypeptidase-like protein n=1 Tax=Burkholderia ubonensis TaxID=101571 RepID=UPI0012FA8356|nr:hypothetical protein [Burkholderia ubonensis]
MRSTQIPTNLIRWPVDREITDLNNYDEDDLNIKGMASLVRQEVDETPATKHHQIVVNNESIQYTATAGHLIAWAPRVSSNRARDAEASIFYMAYTRDDIPHNRRPITFIFGGGPGASSILLHLGSWGPKRIRIGNAKLIENDQSLLDQTDLVYIDMVGSGFSEAIKPHVNQDFWNTDKDANVFRDFITAYINKFNRQSSPKYLMGESYGGIRAPILADLLAKAGTSNYDRDPSGAAPIVLSGIIMQSPVLDYGLAATPATKWLSLPAGLLHPIEGMLPTLGMIADYNKKSTFRGSRSEEDYATYLRDFASGKFKAELEKFSTQVESSENTNFDSNFVSELSEILGFSKSNSRLASNLSDMSWTKAFIAYDLAVVTPLPDCSPVGNWCYSRKYLWLNSSDKFYEYHEQFNPHLHGIYDFSQEVPFLGSQIIFSDYSRILIKDFLSDEFGYKNWGEYGSLKVANAYWWAGNQVQHRNSTRPSSLPDLDDVMKRIPGMRVLIFHGYQDTNAPFYQTELNLSSIKLWPPASDKSRVQIKTYDGGHAMYLNDTARASARRDLREFFSRQTGARF